MQRLGKIIVVGGPTRHVGKTTLVCALLTALDEYRWTAVKITTDDHGQLQPLWEECSPTSRKGSGRYLAAGAERSFLLTSTAEEIPLEPLWAAIAPGTNLIIESNRIVSELEPTVTLALLGTGDEEKGSFVPFVAHADALLEADLTSAATHPSAHQRRFRSTAQEPLPAELLAWIRQALRS